MTKIPGIPGRLPRPALRWLFPWNLSLTPRGLWRASNIPLAAGSSVGTWPDLIGRCGDLAQADPAKQPVLTANQLGGKPAVVFDGVDDFIRRTSFVGGTVTQPTTHFFVLKQNTLAVNARYCDAGAVDGTNRNLLMARNTNVYSWYAGINAPNSIITVDSSWHYFIAILNSPASSSFKRGTSVLFSEADLNPGAQGPNGITIAAGYDATNPAPISIAEWVIFSGTPSSQDLATLAAYANSEYGL